MVSSTVPDASSKRSFFARRVIAPLVAFLKQGTTPEKLALCVALGIVFGIFPVLGSTTLLCAIVALIFRLNQPAMQLVNHLVYPAQLALIVPLLKAGNYVFSSNTTSLTAGVLFHAVKDNPGQAIATFWQATVYAIAVWIVFAPAIAIPAYWVALRIFRRWKAAIRPPEPHFNLKDSPAR